MLYIIQYPRRWLQVLRIFLGTKCRMFQIVSTTHVRSCVVPFNKSLYIGNLWFIYETVVVTWHIAKWYFASIVKGVRLDHISVRAFSYNDWSCRLSISSSTDLQFTIPFTARFSIVVMHTFVHITITEMYAWLFTIVNYNVYIITYCFAQSIFLLLHLNFYFMKTASFRILIIKIPERMLFV